MAVRRRWRVPDVAQQGARGRESGEWKMEARGKGQMVKGKGHGAWDKGQGTRVKGQVASGMENGGNGHGE